MKSTMEKVSTNKIKLRMELDAPAFEEALQKAYLKIRGRMNVPGFRKGKAPRKLIERMYGESVFYEEAFDAVFPNMYEEAVKENDIQVVGQPDISIETISSQDGLAVLAEVYVRPEVTLGEYKNLNVEREDDTVDDEAVDQEVGRVRQRNAREQEVENRPVRDDDIVTLDYAGTVDGVAFEGGAAQNQTLTIGSGQFIPGFEEKIVGMGIGEEKDISVTFPKEYHAEELAGKDAVFHVKVNAIRTRELPELDDEFAKDVSEFDTFEEYKADIKAKLQAEATRRVDAAFEIALLEAAVENAVVDVPPSMVERQIDKMVSDMAMRMAYQRIGMEDFLKYSGQTEEDLRGQYREEAEKRVKGELVLEAIRKAEGIQPAEKDIDAVTARYAEQTGKELEEFRKSLTDRQKEYIAEDAAMIATLSFLKANA
ncbi:MAG: trigger factor [Firmicutes bacterium]|nr:trigger factor [Bacillota bacterium]